MRAAVNRQKVNDMTCVRKGESGVKRYWNEADAETGS